MATIPASQIVNVIPGVLSAGGDALDLNGLFLTNSTQVPLGSVVQFPTAAAVATYFGGNSHEAALAVDYFEGYINKTAAPGNLLFAQFNIAGAVGAYLRGGNISALTLAQLQSISGSLNIVMDGYARNAASINLSGATSQSNAATLIQTGLNGSPSTLASFTGVIAATTLTVSAASGAPLAIGQTLVGAGVTAGTRITALGTGTGGNGTYTINNSQSISSEAMTTQPTPVVVTYDSVSGAFNVASGITGAPSTVAFATGTISGSLLLTSITGAVLSQGSVAAVPAAFMNGVVAQTSNWATFMTTFNPDVSGNTNKLALAAWTSTQLNRFAFVCSDADLSPTTTVPATSSLGYLITQANYGGTYLIFEPGQEKAAFTCGIAASLDFGATNGRTTFAFRAQAGLAADVTDATVAANLIANGYNFYGAYATANQQFVFMQDGSVSGPFNWMDSYINQIKLNASFQQSLMNLLKNVNSIPYNTAGNTMIESALSDDIQESLNFGTIRAGVAPSSDEAVSVNAAAGVKINGTLATRGWYLQVLTPSAIVRQQRGTPECNFWYMDGQSVQRITLSSTNIQ